MSAPTGKVCISLVQPTFSLPWNSRVALVLTPRNLLSNSLNVGISPLLPVKKRKRKRKVKYQIRKEMFYLTMHSVYIRLYGVRHVLNDHSDSERGNPLPPHGLLFPITSIIPQMGYSLLLTSRGALAGMRNSSMGTR